MSGESARKQGLTDIARHVIGQYETQETNEASNAEDDVAQYRFSV